MQSAGISSPKAVMVMYTGKKRSVEAVQRIRLAFPAVNFVSLFAAHAYEHAFYLNVHSHVQTPIYARAQDLDHLLELKEAGATDAILENAEVLNKYFRRCVRSYIYMEMLVVRYLLFICADKFTAWF